MRYPVSCSRRSRDPLRPYGRRKVLVPSLFLFGIASVACALATDFGLLLVLQTLQGVGAAALGAINVTMIGDLYSGQRRTEALGYNSSVLSVGTASYPAIGGALALLGWRYPFALHPAPRPDFGSGTYVRGRHTGRARRRLLRQGCPRRRDVPRGLDPHPLS